MKSQRRLKPTDGKRKAQILEAAAKIFEKKGYDRATLQDIADRVGITKAALYYYFKNKHDLLYEVIGTLVDKGIRELTNIVERPVSIEEKIHLAFEEHFSSYESSFPHYGVLLHEKLTLLPSDIERQMKEKTRRYLSLWEQLIMEGVKGAELRDDLPPKLMVWAAMGMSNWVYKWASPKGRFRFQEIARFFSSIFLEGTLRKGRVS
ncbi:MAG: TetR/AcrR family transcriptional regulator [Pseudomonadota bacterium]